jgi:hypothetical protein
LTPGGTLPAAGEDEQGSFERTRAITAAAAESFNKGHLRIRDDVGHAAASADGDGRIPALFSEEVTPSGEHRVAIRLPGLYAAEWQADHRALHDSGKCTCPTSFKPHQPQIRNEDLTSHDQEKLHRWRDLEAKEMRKEHDTREVEGQVDETLQRIAEIKKMFGEFDIESESPKVNLPRLGGRVTAENQRVESRGQSQGRGISTGRHQRRLENRRGSRASSHPRNPNLPTQPFTPPQEQGQIVPASQTTTPYTPAAIYPGYPNP